MKWIFLMARSIGWALLSVVVLLLLFQHRLIYFPRPYDKPSLWDLEKRKGKRLIVQTSQGRQVAFYLPSVKNQEQAPEFIWMIFGGNGSLALDYAGEPLHWDSRFGYVFVDYPGYGECEGTPNPSSVRESIVVIVKALKEEMHWSDAELQQRTGVLGHSLGCAAALIAAEEAGLKKAVLCAPFTTMTEMARRTVGWPLCELNRHRYDNVARLEKLVPQGLQVHAFHGQIDQVIPVGMSRRLAGMFPKAVTLTEIPDCDHNEVVMAAGTAIGESMLKLSALTEH
jgi:pimeloyl-ACP methyl ester carboxylesterase